MIIRRKLACFLWFSALFFALLLWQSSAYAMIQGSDSPAQKIVGYTPPNFDYAEICITNKAKPISIPSSDDMSNDQKFKVASVLLTGAKNVFPDPVRAIRLMRQLTLTKSKQQNPAKFRLARLYYQGQYVPENKDKAKALVQEIAPSDPYGAAYFLARIYESEGQYIKAEDLYKRSALAGNPMGYLSLAYMYSEGLIADKSAKRIAQLVAISKNKVSEELIQGICNTAHDIGKTFLRDTYNTDNHKYGVLWLEAAAKANSMSAISYLGYMYLNGIQVKQDEKRGLAYYREGALQNDAESFYQLGRYWLVKQSPTSETRGTGAAFLSKAAAQGHQNAILSLVAYYMGEYGDDAQYDKARIIMEKALTLPDRSAKITYNLAEIYANGLGIERNPKRAFNLYEKAAKLNYRDALVKLGDAYKYGNGIDRNPIKSYRFYRQAASMGSRDGMLSLVDNYQCGVGKAPNARYENIWRTRAIHEGAGKVMRPEVVRLMLSKDTNENVEGFMMLKRRVSDSDREAKVLIANFYQKGIGVAKNQSVAKEWIEEATQPGNEVAKGYTALGEAYLDTNLFGINPKLAEKYFLKAVDLGGKDAGYELGKLYQEGAKGFAPNVIKAESAYRIGAKRGHDTAMRKLAQIMLDKGNVVESIALLKRSANRHNIDSIIELAEFYVKQTQENPTQSEEANYWYDQAIAHYPCSPRIKAKLERIAAKMSESKNFEASRNPKELYEAAQKGDAKAALKLAQLYIYGAAGLEPNAKKAFKWYVKAAEYGDAEAMYEIGNAYSTGLGVKPNKKQAKEWWTRAAEAGYRKAQLVLDVDATLVEKAPKKKAH